METWDGIFQTGGNPFHIFCYSISIAIDEVAVLGINSFAYNEQFDLAFEVEEGLSCVKI
jgi:hypothetical protein